MALANGPVMFVTLQHGTVPAVVRSGVRVYLRHCVVTSSSCYFEYLDSIV